ncbi:3-phosphoshikimate 1-carboxyvinyltransferase [Flavobacterium capsici]|uniref:3-phosphoshikimate 1-carboxyvinyltransferase n=1 Tax=Flavobacterium capsici TaxID=3075618 RepID=A0AA96EZN1_9FLAO|nr:MULTISPECIES: 3-phosphoshikimate 1-carboxyvinyltransferase [unclassified Flavobacterium]WNM20040.1 3-phosphoshikimate 1-carboxyvinyltransferase [Flavobacterium sp. PMR2A8]WNM21429.1 3-phosphoshikimate 1-carboxyvinyltransferase [Flavobacterium sp. PMTSA4]
MNLHLNFSSTNKKSSLNITGSKSETNRLLLLQALFPELKLENISISDDSVVMQKSISRSQKVVDIHHAGTAMRFLTAYFAIKENSDVVLTGSSRMKQRPIKFLVDALQQLGAEINYVENENYPPIRIKGKKLTKNKVTLKANVSSQYISALLLIAPKLENGLELVLEGEITSIPYIRMTLALLNEIGIETSFENNIIKVNSKLKTQNPEVKIESDWSSASYYYSIVALSQIGTQIILSNFKKNSFQGDSILVEIYKSFGVETTFVENQIILEKKEYKCSSVKLNLIESPDIAQTIAVTCFGLGVGCRLEGLHTLKIKETDRLEALKKELSKLGAMVFTTDSILQIAPSTRIKENISIKTYQDHRMAMAFAPLALRTNLIIEDSEVVSKSYPTFWDDLKQIGFEIEEIN